MMQKNTCPTQQHTITFNQSIKYITIMFLFLFLSGCFFINFLSSFNAMINDQLVSISKKRINHTWMAAVVYSLFSFPGVAAPCTLFSFPLVSSSSLLLFSPPPPCFNFDPPQPKLGFWLSTTVVDCCQNAIGTRLN
jgi:hypothetical protein